MFVLNIEQTLKLVLKRLNSGLLYKLFNMNYSKPESESTMFRHLGSAKEKLKTIFTEGVQKIHLADPQKRLEDSLHKLFKVCKYTTSTALNTGFTRLIKNIVKMLK